MYHDGIIAGFVIWPNLRVHMVVQVQGISAGGTSVVDYRTGGGGTQDISQG